MKKTVDINELIPLIKESLMSDKKVKFVPFGDSMLPTLAGGCDLVTLVKPDKIKAMDICLYEREDHTYVLHRLVKIYRGEYLMMGDNQEVIEHGIHQSDIIAVVEDFEHGKNHISCQNFCYRLKAYLRYKFRLFRKIKRKLSKMK